MSPEFHLILLVTELYPSLEFSIITIESEELAPTYFAITSLMDLI